MTYNPNNFGTPAFARAVSRQALNASGSGITKFTPIRVTASGMNTVTVSNETHIDNFAGVTREDVANGNSGEYVKDGIIEDVTTLFAVGDPVYISKTGGMTNIKPDIGVASFVAGDFVVRLGFIQQNLSNPALKDLYVMIQIIGQL